MLLNQQHQSDVDGITPMPTDRVDDTSVVNTSSAETVVWYYNNSGAWGAASGQAAGTMCVAKLTYSGVLNSNDSAIGCKNDTSLSFAAATRASTLVQVPEEAFSKMLSMTVADKVAYIATWLNTNGDYAIDHRRGEIWLLTKADPTNDAATYTYATPLSGGGAGDKVDLIKVGGEAAELKDFAAFPASQYRATSNGQDGTVVYASASTLTLSGTPFTVNNEDLVYIREVDATGNTAEVYVNGIANVHIEISSGTITKSGGTDFSANGVYELGYNGQDKAYNAPSDAEQNLRLNPDSQTFVGETLADVTNETDATNYYYMDMAGYRYFAIQLETSGTTPTSTLTVTVEASLQDDGTAAASCAYQDVTNALFGVASWVDTDAMAIVDTEMPFKYVRIKTVTAGGGNDADYTLYAKRMY